MWAHRHGVLLLPTCLPGLESPQALRRINSNAVLSLFWLQLGQTKRPHCMLAPATPTIWGFTAREMSQLCTRLRGRSHWNPELRGRLHPLGTPINGGEHLSLKFPLYSLFRPKGWRKNPQLLKPFSWAYAWQQLQTFGVLCNARNTLRTA